MWLWLVVSLIILSACIIFALRIFATSYTFMTPKQEDKSSPEQSSKVFLSIFSQQASVNELKVKIKTIEENYLAQFNKLQQRIDFLDKEKSKPNKWQEEEDDGGWEALYYKTLKDKETAEEALDAAEQREQSLTIRLKDMEDNRQQASDAEAYKNRILVLEREAVTYSDKEKALETELASAKKIKRDHELLQHLYAHLLTEADELKLRIHEITNRDISLTKKINRLSELESNFEINTKEKSDLRKSVEEIIVENEALSAKLQELQDKLAAEKFA